MKWTRRGSLPALFVSVWLGLPVYGEWHLKTADFRRELKVEGDAATAVTATTTLFLDDRFSGFSLVDSEGKLRPYNLLNRVGSSVSIYFDAVPGEILYLYLSRTAALPAPGGAPPRTGLRHQTRAYDGREVTSSAQFKKLWEKAPFQGGNFAERVYSSFNPFGPNENTLHSYQGTLNIRKGGVTAFCTASTDASFLFINDREVVAWPGKHGVEEGLDGSRRGLLKLEPGIYRFSYLHANSGRASYAIAAMIPPGDKRHFVLSPAMYTHASYAFVGALVSRGGGMRADFIWENNYMVTIRDHVLHKMVFEAAAIKGDENASYLWEFADGARAEGRKVEHLVFKHGDFPVKLSVTSAGQKSTSCQVAHVQPRYGQSERDDKRALELLERAEKQEREKGIQPEGYALISRGWFFFLRENRAAAFAPRVFTAVESMSDEVLNEVMIELALGVQQVREQYELAEKCFRTILENVKDPGARAYAALHCGGMLNLCLNRPVEAREMLSDITPADLDSGGQRLLDIYLADTALVLDDFATAQKMYRAIPRPVAQIEDGELNREVIFADSSRHFRLRNLLSQKLYRESLMAVDMIEWDMPEQRASPRMNLLKVQALIGNNQPKKAVVCIQRALLAEVDQTYTPRLRLELAKLYGAMNHFARAKNQINLIRQESPWSREELEARKLLKKLEEQIRR